MKITIHTSKEGAEAAMKLLAFAAGHLDAHEDLMHEKGIKYFEKGDARIFREKLSIGLRRATSPNKVKK